MKWAVIPFILLILLLPCAKPQIQKRMQSHRSRVYAQVDRDTKFDFENKDGNRLSLRMPLEEASTIMGTDDLTQYKTKETTWSIYYTYGPFEFITAPQDEYFKDRVVAIRYVKKDVSWKLVPGAADIGMSKAEITANLGDTSENYPQEPDAWTYLFNSNTNLTIIFTDDKVSQIELWMGM
ncbi:MAG: hypothetical protein P8107_08740 [Spirochaetia bacterium]